MAIACIANWLVWDVSLAGMDPYLSIFDARGYASLGQQLLGAGPIDGARLAQRGYLFSGVTGLLLAVHPLLLFGTQVAAVAVGLWCLCEFERRIAGRVRLMPLALLMPSLWLAPGHLMTESLAFGLAACGCLLLVSRPASWGAVSLWAAALMKPALLPGALAASVIPIRRRTLLPLLTVVLLISPQLLLTARHSDQMALSTAGVDNFAERFHPAVMGMVDTGTITRYRDEAAIRYRAAAPKLEYKIADVLVHPWATVRTWQHILRFDHLWQSSGYLARNIAGLDWSVAEPLKRWSLWVNILLSLTVPLGLTGIVLFVRQAPAERWPVVVAGPGIVILAPLVYWQGDRVVLAGILLMLPFASLALRRLLGKI